MEEMINKTPFR